MTPLVQCLMACRKPEGQSPAPQKPDVMVPAWGPSAEEVEVRRAGVQGHPQLHREFEASLGYIRLCLKDRIKPWPWVETLEGKLPL